MCDDLTKQEILFFTIMQAHPDGISEDEIFEGMSKLSLNLGWPYYLNAVPKPLSERLVEARDRGMIAKYRPLCWRPTPGLGAYVRHLTERYIEKQDQRQMILAQLEEELHAAE